VFLPTLSFLCFFCFMLICQLAIGGQKGGGFCQHRIEVILLVSYIYKGLSKLQVSPNTHVPHEEGCLYQDLGPLTVLLYELGKKTHGYPSNR
jgi:hypothetical protein